MSEKRTLSKLSVVVPCFNEQDVIAATHQRLSAILEGLRTEKKIADYEIVLVDNGSTDATLSVMKGLCRRDTQVRILELRRNFGYQGSISAGIFHAQGDAIVTIDADLQDPPEKIGEMIEHYQNGYDLVLGIRADRSTDSFLKRVFSQWYYRFIRKLGVDVVYNHGDFRLMAAGLAAEFNDLPERNRFIRAMILQLESRYATVSYKREARTAGSTKFDLPALLSLSIDGIVSFSYVPLRLAALLGVFLCAVAMMGIVWVFYIKIATDVIPGWASTMLPLFLFSGFQLLVLGLIGEYIGKLYIEVKQRPVFLVRRIHEHDKK